MLRPHRRSALISASLLTAVALLAGCSGAGTSAEPARSVPAGGADGAGYPVTIENCGRSLTFKAPPRRVVSLWQAPTEMLLALGAQKNMAAIAGNYAPLPHDLAAAAKNVPTIGTLMAWPSREVLLSQEPDLVVGQVLEGFAFDTSSGYASVEQIEQGGSQVYGANACDLAQVREMTIDTPAKTLRDLGRIVGRSEQAETIIAGIQAQKEVVTDAVAGLDPVKVAFYQGGTGPLHVLAGGIYDSEITTAGGRDVFGAEADVSKEEFSAIDADVILVGTYQGQDFESAKKFLTTTFPDVPAVRDDRLVELPVAETDASLGVMDGLTRIAAGLHPQAGLSVPTS